MSCQSSVGEANIMREYTMGKAFVTPYFDWTTFFNTLLGTKSFKGAIRAANGFSENNNKSGHQRGRSKRVLHKKKMSRVKP